MFRAALGLSPLVNYCKQPKLVAADYERLLNSKESLLSPKSIIIALETLFKNHKGQEREARLISNLLINHSKVPIPPDLIYSAITDGYWEVAQVGLLPSSIIHTVDKINVFVAMNALLKNHNACDSNAAVIAAIFAEKKINMEVGNIEMLALSAAQAGFWNLFQALSNHLPKTSLAKLIDDLLTVESPTHAIKNSALHYAVLSGDQHIVNNSLRNIDPNLKNDLGQTAVMLLVFSSNVQDTDGLIKLLLSHGADVNARDNQGNTALHYAAMHKHADVASGLINNGADPLAVNHDNKSPGMMVRSLKIEILLNQVPDTMTAEQQVLLDNYRRHNEDGRIGLLTQLMKNKDYAGLDLLTRRVSDLTTAGRHNKNALHLAAEFGDSQVIKLLVNRGMDSNEIAFKGNTALHFAAFKGRLDTIKALVELGAKTDILNVAAMLAKDMIPEQITGEQRAVLERYLSPTAAPDSLDQSSSLSM